MLGKPTDPGVTFLTVMELYHRINAMKSEKTVEVAVSYLEVIYVTMNVSYNWMLLSHVIILVQIFMYSWNTSNFFEGILFHVIKKYF